MPEMIDSNMRPTGWTPGQWRYFREYTREIADKLGLRDWRLQMQWHPTKDDSSGASITFAAGRRIADVRLCEDFLSLSPLTQREYIVHELLHCQMLPMSRALESIETIVGSSAYNVLNHLHSLAIENTTDALAYDVARLLPACVIPPADAVLTVAVGVDTIAP